MTTPKINTEVNVSINQNDIVDIMLEEQLDLKEAEIKELQNRLVILKDRQSAITSNIEELVIKSNGFTKHPDYKDFTAVTKTLKLDFELTPNVIWNAVETISHDFWNFSAFETYKNPLTMFKKARTEYETHGYVNTYNLSPKKERVTLSVPKYIEVILKAAKNNILISGGIITLRDIKITKTAEKRISELHSTISSQMEVKKLIQEREIERFMLEYDSRRAKVKFIKGMLKNSDQGKQLLKLVGNIKNTNLLSA